MSKQNNNKPSEQLYCSPSRYEMGKNDKTCYSLDELKTIAADYNNNLATKPQKVKAIAKERLSTKSAKAAKAEELELKTIKLNQSKTALLKSLKRQLNTICGDAQHCWVQQEFISPHTRNTILNNALRPLKPKEWYDNPKTWLNTYDILKVMKQYEKRYNDFSFLGVFPIDFQAKDENGQCIASGMCDFNIKRLLSKDKKRFAMILNLDKHNEPGSHWVSLYCNMSPNRNNFGIYYYDSVAYAPPKEVALFMKNVKTQIINHFDKDTSSKFTMKHNKIQKQFANTECGVFSEVFLTQICKDIKYEDICAKMKTDSEINKIRDVLYTPSV